MDKIRLQMEDLVKFGNFQRDFDFRCPPSLPSSGLVMSCRGLALEKQVPCILLSAKSSDFSDFPLLDPTSVNSSEPTIES